MALYTVQIVNTSPLLMNNPHKMRAGGSDEPGVKKIPTPEVEAERSTYRRDDGQLYLTSTMFRGSLLNACIGQKVGKRSAAKVFGASLFTTMAEECPLHDPMTGAPVKTWETDARRVVVQGNGVVRGRARIPSWACSVEFEFDPDFVGAEWITKMLNLAGKIAGVGDYRPASPKGKGGPFGRFRVEGEPQIV